jgi:hypothetical protein
MAEWTVLDLFCGLGGFSSAFENSDEWDVVTVDIDERFDPTLCADVFDLRPSDFTREVDVMLASPPCTAFSKACPREHYWDGEQEPALPETRDFIGLVYHALGLIRGLAPVYYFIENPIGRLRWYLGEPTGKVAYCQYGRPYMKPTDLWGEHPPMKYRWCGYDANCHSENTHGGVANTARPYPRDRAERAKVPRDLSEAIRKACEAGLRGEVAEQVTLDAV